MVVVVMATAISAVLPAGLDAKPRVALAASTGQPYSTSTLTAVRQDAEWILTAQLPDGAIAHYPDKVAVWPYLSNFAAVGLVRATEVTDDARYLKAAVRWLEWYQAHQTPEGFVTDYRILEDGTVISTGDMDSTDAYAGTFLYATWTAYNASNDRAALNRLRSGIDAAVRAVEATLDADGLTWAKPTYRVKYLMDQAEVYVGLRAASKLKSALGDKAGARRVSELASRLKAAVDALWNPSLQGYDWAVHESGAHDATMWSVFYPDALQQMWAAAFGLTDTVRSSQLAGLFTQLHPYWDEPNSTWTIYGAERKVDYWPVAGWALIRAGQTAQAVEAAANMRSAADATGRAWPHTPATAGQLIVLLTGGLAIPPN